MMNLNYQIKRYDFNHNDLAQAWGFCRGENNAPISKRFPPLREAMYRAFNEKCFYTGMRIAKKGFHIDHVVPTALGGSDIVSNYVVSSPHINAMKRDALTIDQVIPLQYIINTVYIPRVRNLLPDILISHEASAKEKYNDCEDLWTDSTSQEIADFVSSVYDKDIIIIESENNRQIDISRLTEKEKRQLKMLVDKFLLDSYNKRPKPSF